MDDALMNHYEKQLYTVFKTFDVDNEEALDRAAVLQLCDALQLEARGAALVDALFERRAGRVTFATFRNGLLGVLGAAPEPAPAPPHSDDDSSGREVAPRLVVGGKKYGRRSRPVRADEPAAPRAASASRLDADADAARRPRVRYRRSASAMEARAADDARLDHDRRIDCAQAVALCRDLRMDGIDPRLVERIFEAEPSDETTVGEFFDRLNAALTTIATAADAEPAPAPAAPPAAEPDDEDALPGEAVADAWERAGVRRPRRLLAELGFAGAALRAADLERALDDELRALGSPPPRDERLDARPLLQLAALVLARLRLARVRARAGAAAAERDKLRADLAEANRRAQLLAQDVDENHARLEAERQVALRLVEARHAEAARAAAAELAAERERAAAARAALDAEAARRGEAEARLREELAVLSERADGAERRAAAAGERAALAERERAQAADEARAAAARGEEAAERARAAAAALGERLRALQGDNARLRDRADELAAALEARAPSAPPPPAPGPADTSWRDETEAELDADVPTRDRIDECDSAPVSMERRSESPADVPARGAPAATPARTDAAAQTEPAPADETLEDLRQKHEAEKAELIDSIASLERGLDELRLEGERSEEYWAAKLADERAAAADDAAAADARLAELLRRVADYERAFRPQLPALHESALEPQHTQLQQEFEEFKAEAARELAATREAAAARAAEAERELAAARAASAACSCRQKPRRASSDGEPAAAHAGDGDAPSGRRSAAGAAGGAPPAAAAVQPCACAWGAWGAWGRGRAAGAAEAAALRARAGHAERAAARLLARLHAADALVADLYRENCQLQHHKPRPPRLL